MTKATKVLGPTSIATTVVTEQTVSGSAWSVPARAQTLLAVKVEACGVAVPTAAEAQVVQLRIYSESAKIEPCTVLAEPLGGAQSTHSGADLPAGGRERWYPINAPIKEGNEIYFYAKALIATTTVIYVTVTILYSTGGPETNHGQWEARQYYHSVGTYTATSATAAATTSGTAFNITGTKITKVYALVVITTPAAGKGLAATMAITSEDFKESWSLTFGLNMVPGWLGTNTANPCCPMTETLTLDYPLNLSGQTRIVDKHTTTVATTTAGAWIICIQYLK